MLNVGFKKLTETAILPVKAHATDSGFDLFADERVIVQPEQTVVVSTGIACVLPPNHEATIRPRSGVTARTKLRVQLGTIDNAYRGDLGVIVDNIYPLAYDSEGDIYCEPQLLTIGGLTVTTLHELHAAGTFVIEKGDKIAQLVVTPLPASVGYEITGELDDTDRGENGFGSTGTNAA